MIKPHDKVQYIGKASYAYMDEHGGKKGRVISEPYQLSSVPGQSFVDVEWFFAPIADPNKVLIRDAQAGHVVNVENLRKLD